MKIGLFEDEERARAVEKALAGQDLNGLEVETLLKSRGHDLFLLGLAADHLRKITVGDTVTYVVNRNINYTNVCILNCEFCAFSRNYRSPEGFFIPVDEIVRMAEEVWKLGATEVCIQGGLPPKMDWGFYPRVLRAIKSRVPEMHLHAFSPEEIWYGSKLSGMKYRDFIRMLKEAGLDSVPGTSAEILDDSVRREISPGRLSADEWTSIMREVHSLGIPSTATIMYGHVESEAQRAGHIVKLRELEKESPGFTEFVPLSFIPYRTRLLKRVNGPPSAAEVIALYATSRLVLNKYIRNIQVSWVKEGPRFAQMLLNFGANDFGGTLINESISSEAGAGHGQFLSPAEIRRLIVEAGRRPAQRDTVYRIIKEFDGVYDASPVPLESINYDDSRFGNYSTTVRKWRYK
ncbi:MAG: 5-amino-6-(D-ribitylamino)uracil--L-tyrosine 4-hydroxyphenyl transferase CofH [Nitrososphaerota archaeon]|jgi:FO synthase subunit 2|nr:5-amino-6-(D-ribitylamino)uracil--L-tyrosine 4-hydroxyphenyl transferase CofH [Nitrososphaerota archaeon]MDG7038368.1 5-amino-6-(D-ribitylamino)uracil--L-tyrosine 4-hydroxyphenyl transferase CofH [Nitrososphaerota archaeon]